MIWFTSDEHYGHENIIKFCNRPFKDDKEQTEEMIRRHNEVVGDEDVVYHLGYMFWDLPAAKSWGVLVQLKGHHKYIWGNHEKGMKDVLRVYHTHTKIEVLGDLYTLKPPLKPSITLLHYSMRTWPNSHRGSYHLFGHTHNAIQGHGLSMDAGVDANGFYPISIEQVHTKMQEKAKTLNLYEYKCSHCQNFFYSADPARRDGYTTCKCGKEMEVTKLVY